MKILITSDLHLTSRKSDAYRFAFFDWLVGKAQLVDAVLILGDLTDAKDNHSAELVNMIVANLRRLTDCCPVYLLKGNHDYTDPACPFFGFLGYLPNLHYIKEPSLDPFGLMKALFIPHTQSGRLDDWTQSTLRDSKLELVLMHQTVTGARSTTGRVLEGLPASVFEGCRAQVYSGDLHVPQTVGKVIYVGAPYPIHFGDNYIPKVILRTLTRLPDGSHAAGRIEMVTPPYIRKIVLTIHRPEDVERADLSPGDQARVVAALPRSEFGSWDEYRRTIAAYCKSAGIYLYSLELHESEGRVRLADDVMVRRLQKPGDVFDRYCKFAELEDEATIALGRKLIVGGP